MIEKIAVILGSYHLTLVFLKSKTMPLNQSDPNVNFTGTYNDVTGNQYNNNNTVTNHPDSQNSTKTTLTIGDITSAFFQVILLDDRRAADVL